MSFGIFVDPFAAIRPEWLRAKNNTQAEITSLVSYSPLQDKPVGIL